ncbi:MAG: helix-turn-helix transcriptional regulator [Defluviitaleaceae bacterium]|nr:helix-turn-helix transcriptional regulator [Defluviitaleaceae bacterium]
MQNEVRAKLARRSVRKANKSNLDKEVGVRIRTLRREMDISVDRLSEILDITPSHVRLIEYGQRGVTLSLCQKLCDTFNLTSDYLIYGDARKVEIPVTGDFNTISDIAANSLNQEERDFFAEVMKEYTHSRSSATDAKLLKDALHAQLKSFFELKASITNVGK